MWEDGGGVCVGRGTCRLSRTKRRDCRRRTSKGHSRREIERTRVHERGDGYLFYTECRMCLCDADGLAAAH